MGDQDDDRDGYRLEDILAFKEEDLKDYTAEVQQYVAAAMKLKASVLSKLCENNEVVQSELRQAGFHPTWTKVRMVRDLMVHGVALDTDEEVDPSVVVPNRWKEPSAEDGDNIDDTGHGGDAVDLPVSPESSSAREQEGLEPASSLQQTMALVQELRSRLEEQELRSQRQDLEIVRLRASKSEPARECGIGLESVPLRSESKGLLWPSTTNAFETKSLTTKQYQDLVKNNSSDELDWYKRPGMSPEVAKYANKTEFSLKHIWENHTKIGYLARTPVALPSASTRRPECSTSLPACPCAAASPACAP